MIIPADTSAPALSMVPTAPLQGRRTQGADRPKPKNKISVASSEMGVSEDGAAQAGDGGGEVEDLTIASRGTRSETDIPAIALNRHRGVSAPSATAGEKQRKISSAVHKNGKPMAEV